jgi:hypothetical protein
VALSQLGEIGDERGDRRNRGLRLLHP